MSQERRQTFKVLETKYLDVKFIGEEQPLDQLRRNSLEAVVQRWVIEGSSPASFFVSLYCGRPNSPLTFSFAPTLNQKSRHALHVTPFDGRSAAARSR